MNIFEIVVHPAADVFPMLEKDELQALADDIKTNGLLDPIVVQEIDGTLMLVDGRNRRAACELAGVEPDVIHLNGQDTTAYIFSKNITRRNLTAGQRAMAHALLYPKEKGGRGKKTAVNSRGFGEQALLRARYLLAERHQALRDQVMSGSVSLNAAYTQAKEKDEDLAQWEADYEWLRQEAPDYARQVKEDGKSVSEMKRRYQQDLEDKRVERAGFWTILENMQNYSGTFTDEGMERLTAYINEYGKDECKVNLQQLAERLMNISKYLGEQKNVN